MIIIDIILAILYILVIIVAVLLIIVLAIPVGILYGLYWLLFKSWSKKKQHKKIVTTKKKQYKSSGKQKAKDIQNIVSKAIKAKQNKEDFDPDQFRKEINDFVEDTVKSTNIDNEK